MAFMLKNLKNVITPCFNLGKTVQYEQVRMKFPSWKMLKDFRRRETVKKYGPERLRLIMMKKATVLPSAIKEVAANDIAEYPRDASITRIVYRCGLTSRPRGTVKHFKVSRIIFRNIADNNQISGMQRAMW